MSYKVEMRRKRIGTLAWGDWLECGAFEHNSDLGGSFKNSKDAHEAVALEREWDIRNVRSFVYDYKVVEDSEDELMRLRKLEDDLDRRIRYHRDEIETGLDMLKEYALKGDRGMAEMRLDNILGRVAEVKVLENLKKGVV